MARLTPAVMRTFDILELFVTDGPELAVADILARTEVPRTSLHELLATMVARDYLQRDERTGLYRLGVGNLHLGNAYSSRFDLLAAANTVARDLVDRSGETVSVAVREGANVFYLAKVDGRDSLRLPSSIGQRLPAHLTGLGKALLATLPADALRELYPHPNDLPVLTAHSIRTLADLEADLEDVRARGGVAFESEESTPNLRCAAAPVRDATGVVIAAISVSVPLARWDQSGEAHWVQLALSGAAQLSEQLGYRAPAA